jgi:serine/threonine-protein kinase mTOR
LRANLDLAYRGIFFPVTHHQKLTVLELPSGQFSLHYNDIIQRISQLIHGNDTSERLGGILALDSLIEFRGDDAGQKTTRFASFLRSILRGNDTAAMIAAAKSLGRLAIPGGTITAELVEAEVKTALEHLQTERQENRRFAAALTLNELARNSPTLLFGWIPQILDILWMGLRDPKIMIREAAAETLAACMDILSTRDVSVRSAYYQRVYDDAFRGTHSPNPEVIHGSLLALEQLLNKGGMFMHGSRYRETCELVLRYKDHRDSLVRREVIQMVPILASYTPPEFTANYLHQCMLHLQGLLKREKDRNLAFVAVGKVASAVGSSIAPYLESILGYIKEGLMMKAQVQHVHFSLC